MTSLCFGWLKTIALMRKLRHRGVGRVDWLFTFACAAYNLVRMRTLPLRAIYPPIRGWDLKLLVRPRPAVLASYGGYMQGPHISSCIQPRSNG